MLDEHIDDHDMRRLRLGLALQTRRAGRAQPRTAETPPLNRQDRRRSPLDAVAGPASTLRQRRPGIATRADLGTFAHVHPEPTGRPGELVFPTTGRYVINTEFRRQGEMGDITTGRRSPSAGRPTRR
jgi:hypothetical protein